MFCKNCGVQLQNGVNFCPSCGTKVSSFKVKAEPGFGSSAYATFLFMLTIG